MIDVREDEHSLRVECSWWTPAQSNIIGFALAWNAFIVFFLFQTGGYLPTIFYFTHVLSGLLMAYYSLCVILNTTTLQVSRGQLSVTHAPLPWWRKTQRLGLSRLEQIYVKSEPLTSKGKTRYFYALYARMRHGPDRKLLVLPDGYAKKAKKLEKKLEKHLQVPDYPVKGEYTGRTSGLFTSTFREQRQQFRNADQAFLYQAQEQEFVDIDHVLYQVISVEQTDWFHSDNSDRLLRLQSSSQLTKQLYIRQQERDLWSYWENKLPENEAQTINFDPDDPPVSIRWQGNLFHLHAGLRGKSGQEKSTSAPELVDQWIYLNEQENEQLRIRKHYEEVSIYTGTILQLQDQEELPLIDRLDLLPLAPEEPLYEEAPSWREDDLV